MVNVEKTLSHCDFRKSLAMALLDPKGYFHQLNNVAIGAVESSIAEEDSVVSYVRPSSKCSRITDASMNPDTSLFSIRLIKSVGHSCEPAENRNTKCCALHRYATGRQIRQQLLRCSICNVFLCSSCFPLFHTERDSIKIKRKIKKDMDEYDKKHSK